MATYTWKWCILKPRVAAVKLGPKDTISGLSYIFTQEGIWVRSDDLELVLNTEVEFFCPHSGRCMIKPISKGLAPVGAVPPESVEVVAKASTIIEEVSPVVTPVEDINDERETKPRRGRPANKQMESQEV